MRLLPSSHLIRSVGYGIVGAVLITGACATATPVSGSQSSARTPTPSAGGGAGTVTVVPQSAPRWPVRTEQHVDLWLHAFALLSNDDAPVPLFKRGYRDSVTAVKNRNNVVTSLDANRATLAKRLAANRTLVQAQFLALSFNNFAEMQFASDKFLQMQGDSKRASDAASASQVAQFAAVFPTAADRDWLRLFMTGVADEQARWFGPEYARVTAERRRVVVAIDSIWQGVYRPKFERFLNNTSQRQGVMLLSLPVGGEGRTSVGNNRETVIAVPFPARPADAIEAVLVLAHEAVGNLVGTVIADNTTPAQQRSGEAVNFVAFGQVQGGLLLLQKVAPELAEPYARYYLGQAGKVAPAGSAVLALKAAFPLPQPAVDGMMKQIEIVLAGI